jgi:hypothetical protein
MSRITCYPQQYICPICEKVQKHYVWSNEVEKAKFQCSTEGCTSTKKLTVEDIYDEPVVEVCSIKTMTKDRIGADRRNRSHKHFVREVLPTLPKGSDERRHHMVKNGYGAKD